MIAPAWALTAWPYIKRALPYLAVALAVFAAYNWAYSRGKASQVPIIRELTASLKQANENTATLKTALEEQNAAVAMLATREAEARKAANAAVQAGRKRERELSGTKARLDALARSRGNVAAVPVPAEVAEAWGKLK
jgi:chromosome segregation ATPase